MPVLGVTRFEQFFRAAAGLDVDKNDLKRYSDFVSRKLRDLLIAAEGNARANGRDVILHRDLPLTGGLQQTVHEFRRLDQEVELEPILETLAAHPPLDLTLGDETEQRLPEICGGLSLALARAMTIIDPGVKLPHGEHWERAFRVFDLLI